VSRRLLSQFFVLLAGGKPKENVYVRNRGFLEILLVGWFRDRQIGIYGPTLWIFLVKRSSEILCEDI
jgi:hypothetical protein